MSSHLVVYQDSSKPDANTLSLFALIEGSIGNPLYRLVERNHPLETLINCAYTQAIHLGRGDLKEMANNCQQNLHHIDCTELDYLVVDSIVYDDD
jgi:hypothetical protein